MQLNPEKASEFGDFSIEPTAGLEILAVYIDFETKLLIVEEIAERSGGAQPIRVTTIDARAARIVPPAERKNFIDYSERTETDAGLGLTRTFRREINFETGNEFIIEKLCRADEEISGSTRIAFGQNASPNVFDSYRQRLKEQEREESFWQTEYRAKDFEQRAAYWASMMFRHMRWQSESGLDEYAGFTPDWYEYARRREPDFDHLLAFIFERYRYEFDYQGYSETEIRRRLSVPPS